MVASVPSSSMLVSSATSCETAAVRCAVESDVARVRRRARHRSRAIRVIRSTFDCSSVAIAATDLR